MKRSFALATFAFAFAAGACSAPVSPTSALAANAVTPASAAPGAAGPAAAAAVPFRGSLEGTQSVTPLAFPLLAVDGSGAGTATMLGRFTVRFPHTVTLTTRIGVGTYTFTAADGDTLTADFSGQAAEDPPLVSIEEHATITGGTGRFDGATGSFVVRRQFNQATGATSGTFEGSVMFAAAQHP
jgi:hypothetical protein